MATRWRWLFALLLLALGGRAEALRQISVQVNDIVYDRFSGRIYASVPSRVGRGGNSIVAIDPVTGVIGPSVFVGSEPGKLALSDDGHYLYVALDGAAAVRRLDLRTGIPDLQFSLGFGYGPNFAGDMAVLPGHAESIAISKYNRGISPSHVHVAIYDNGVQRPHVAAGANWLAFSATADRLYGFHSETTDWSFIRWNLDDTGIVSGDSIPGLVGNFGTTIQFAGGRIFHTSGGAVDPEAGLTLGSFGGGPLVADAPMGRIYVLRGGQWGDAITLYAYDWTTFVELGERPMPELPGPAKMVRWGADGLALLNGDRITLMSTTEVVPPDVAFTVGLDRDAVVGGAPLSGTVTLDAPAPAGGTLVQLASTDAAATVPPGMRVPAGETTVSFPIATHRVEREIHPVISAAADGMTRTVELRVTPAPPAAPSDLRLVVNGGTEIDLAWSDRSENEKGFEVERKGAKGWEKVATLPAGTTTYVDSGLSRFSSYRYRVRAVNGEGSSDWTGEAEAETGKAPVLQVDAASLDFGPAPLGGDPASRTLVVTNTGTAPLSLAGVEVKGADAGAFAVIDDGGGAGILAPGESRALRLTYTPGAAGSQSARLSLASNAAVGPDGVALSGTGVPVPALTLDPGQLGFEEQRVGTGSDEQVVQVRNTGTAPLTLQSVSLEGEQAPDFALTGVSGVTLGPGQTGFIGVRFAPKGTGPRAARLLIRDNAAGSPHAVALAGVGTAPVLSIRISRLSAAATLGFGSQTVGTPGDSQSLTLANTGTAPLTITGINVTGGGRGEFAVVADSGERLLAPGASRTLSLRFTPQAAGNRSASLVVTDNAAGSPHAVSLTGSGVVTLVPPAAPGRLEGRASGPGAVALTWADSSENETGFAVWRKIRSGGWEQVAVVGANATRYQDRSLPPATTYRYRVRAIGPGGASDWTTEVEVATLDAPPAAPANLAASAVSATRVKLTWKDNSSNEGSFDVWRKAGDGAYQKIAIVAANATSYTDNGVTGTTSYTYKVRAYGSGGPSGWTGEAPVTTLDFPPTAPGDLAASAVSATQIKLTWKDNSGNEGSFDVWRKAANGSYQKIAIVAPNTTGYTDNGVTAGTSYTYRVRAYGRGGGSGWTNEGEITTPGGP
jgi:P pilus assembly chaperone PapD